MAGNYRSPSAWSGSLDIVTRGDQLVSIAFGPLVQERAGYWRAAEDKWGYKR